MRLFCYAFGFPLPKLHWYKDGKLLNTTQYGVSYKNTSSWLNITTGDTGATYSDAGDYTCKAYSSVQDKTMSKTIEVLCKYMSMSNLLLL